jgi:hypothetical protein
MDGLTLLAAALVGLGIIGLASRVARTAAARRRFAARRVTATPQVLERGCLTRVTDAQSDIDDALTLRFDRAIPVEAHDDGA